MKSDDVFLEGLERSHRYVALVARWMQERDCEVLIRPSLARPSFELRNDYADAGDIEIRQRVEVKHRAIDFTCSADYPYATVLVDEVFKVDRIPRGQLWGYIVLNRPADHACLIPSATRREWSPIRRYDKKDGQERDFYACPRELCAFTKLGD